MRQKMLWTKAEGHVRQMTALLARNQNGSADKRLCHCKMAENATCIEGQHPRFPRPKQQLKNPYAA